MYQTLPSGPATASWGNPPAVGSENSVNSGTYDAPVSSRTKSPGAAAAGAATRRTTTAAHAARRTIETSEIRAYLTISSPSRRPGRSRRPSRRADRRFPDTEMKPPDRLVRTRPRGSRLCCLRGRDVGLWKQTSRRGEQPPQWIRKV